MATTTNYGWTTPDDTALVKDGAAAIRTLGSSVDTTTKALNPSTTLGDIEYRSSTANTNTRLGIGTSGQALTVVAGVPSWAASPTSVLTTTGDVLYASAANTLARLGIGSSGNVLTVSGGLPAWVAPTATGTNFSLLNSGGTSLSGTTTTVSGISGKNKIFIFLDAASTTNAGNPIFFRLNTDTGNNYSYFGNIIRNPTTYTKTQISNLDTNLFNRVQLGEMSTNAGSSIYAGITIDGCNSSGVKVFSAATGVNDGGGNNGGAENFQGIYIGTSTISSISIVSIDGSFDGGTVYVYTSA